MNQYGPAITNFFRKRLVEQEQVNSDISLDVAASSSTTSLKLHRD